MAEPDYGALDWVREEIESNLRSARQSLEAYVEGPADPARIEDCIHQLHQIDKVLAIMELEGVGMLAREMHDLANAVLEGRVTNLEAAYDALMQGIVQFPGTLERVQREERDDIKRVVGLVNDLRTAYGADPLSVVAGGIQIDLSALQGVPNAEDVEIFRRRGKDVRQKARAAFQRGLLECVRDPNGRRQRELVLRVCGGLVKLCGRTPMGRFFLLLQAFSEALVEDPGPLTPTDLSALSQADGVLKRMALGGDQAILHLPPLQLARTFAERVARSGAGGPARSEAFRLLSLRSVDPSEPPDAPAPEDGEARRAVAQTLRDELIRIKDRIDAFVRTPEPRDPDQLRALIPDLRQVAGTLQLLESASLHAIVLDEIEVIENFPLPGGDVATLMEVAGALLAVEHGIEAMISTGVANVDDAQLAEVHRVVLAEAAETLQDVKEAVAAFEGSHWEHAELMPVVTALNSVRGGLTMIDQARAAGVIRLCAAYCQGLLDSGAVPDWRSFDRFTEAISGIEFFIERMMERGGRMERRVLEYAEESVSTLAVASPERLEEVLSAELQATAEAIVGEDEGEVAPSVAARAAELLATEDEAEDVLEAPVEDLMALGAEDELDLGADDVANAELEIEPAPEVDLPPVSTPAPEPQPEPVALAPDPDPEPAPEPAAHAPEPEPLAPEPEPLDLDTPILEEVEAAPARGPSTIDRLGDVDLDDVALPDLPEPGDDGLPELIDDDDLLLTGIGLADDNDATVDRALALEDELWDDVIEPSPVSPPPVLPPEPEPVVEEPPVVEAEPQVAAPVLPEPDEPQTPEHVPEPVLVDELQVSEPEPPRTPFLDEPDPVVEAPAAPAIERSPEPPAVAAQIAAPPPAPAAPAAPPAPVDIPPAPLHRVAQVAGVDEEIAEVFMEEFDEVMETMVPAAAAVPGDEAVREVRRGFHTLKGSGRMAGAEAVGEMSWALENLLNRIVDGTLGVSDDIKDVITRGVHELPAMRAAYAGAVEPSNSYMALIEQADVLASGGSLAEFGDDESDSDEDAPIFFDDEAPVEAAPVIAAPSVETPLTARPSPFLAEEDELGADLDELPRTPLVARSSPFLDLDDPDEGIGEVRSAPGEAPIARPSPFLDLDAPEDDLDDGIVGPARTVSAPEPRPTPFLEPDDLDDGIGAVRTVAADAAEPADWGAEDDGIGAVRTTDAEVTRPGVEWTLEDDHWDDEEGVIGRARVVGEADVAPPAFDADVAPEPAADFDPDGVVEMEIDFGDDEGDEPLAAFADDELEDEEEAELDHDPAILDIFVAEATTYLRTLRNFATECRVSGFGEVDQDVYQAAHTITGSASMAEIDWVTVISEPLERVLLAWRQSGLPLPASLAESVADAIMALGDCIEARGEAGARATAVDAAYALNAAADAAGDPGASSVNPRELLELEDIEFLIDADKLLEDWGGGTPDMLALSRLEERTRAFAERAAEYELDDLARLAELTWAHHGQERPDIALLRFGHDELIGALDALAIDRRPQVSEEAIERLERRLEELAAEPGQIAEQPGEFGETPALEQEPEAFEESEGLAPGEAEDALDSELDAAELEILEVFFEETQELRDVIDQNVQGWSDNPDDLGYLETLLRALHTLKGGARMAGLARLGDSTHALESDLISFHDRREAADSTYLASVQERFDHLLDEVDDIRYRVTSGESPFSSEPDGAATEEVRVRASAEPGSGAPIGQEMIRVPARAFEGFVNLAGEASISRTRVEQEVRDFREELQELETTIVRVREHVRQLEMEMEAQTLFRSETNRAEYEEFDPLEMDRYSMVQALTRSLSESASDLLDLRETLSSRVGETETILQQQSRLHSDLQEGLMRSRMVPFSHLIPRLRRIVRQVGAELNKEVELIAIESEGEIDRIMLERMTAPLEHMVRNAVDHGIEPEQVRVAQGKPAVGRIEVSLVREGGDVVLTLADDGGGVDASAVRQRAIERELISPDATLSDAEILQFIMAPGISTASEITQISGRGVGLDVVSDEVRQIGGSVAVESTPGEGTSLIVRLPFTVSVNRALMVNVGDDAYAVPLNMIEGIVRVPPADLEGMYARSEKVEYAGQAYDLRYLGAYLGREHSIRQDLLSVPVVLMRSGDEHLGLHVDGVQGSREIVVKSLGPMFAGVSGVSGATILGDGSVVVILDLLALIRDQITVEAPTDVVPQERTACIMVVDDSVTVRKVTSRLLERRGFEVMLAKDGVEAVAQLEERRPDVILLDIEMPRMDGFEVARHIRDDERYRNLPIVMISSRTGSKHRDRAFELGVREFLGKPFQETELVSTIDGMLANG